MNEVLPSLAQAFLIPIAILFIAVCNSRNPLQRGFISLVGLAFSVALLGATMSAPGGLPGVAEVGLLSIFLGVSWLVHGVVQLMMWRRERKQVITVE